MKEKRRIRVLYFYIIITIVVVVFSVLTLYRMSGLRSGVQTMQEITEEYIVSRQAISDMREASNHLTEKARVYVISGDQQYLQSYLEEVDMTKRREKALEVLGGYRPDSSAYQALETAVSRSHELAELEMYAMRMQAEADGMDPGMLTAYFSDTALDSEDAALSAEEKHEKAVGMLFDENYQTKKEGIMSQSLASMDSLMDSIRQEQLAEYEETMNRMNWVSILMILVLAAMIVGLIVSANSLVLPINKGVAYIREHKELPVRGAAEYAYLAEAYNRMLQKTQEHHEQLSFEATHDELTSLYNRKVFEEKREELAGSKYAMLLIDVDYFKTVNDTYGHNAGDKVLQHIASILASCFRLEDYVCRIGGDEFAVIMQHMEPTLEGVVQSKIERVREMLANSSGDSLPPSTLSIGAAFSGGDESLDVFKKADAALYEVKERGRNGYAFYRDADSTGREV